MAAAWSPSRCFRWPDRRPPGHLPRARATSAPRARRKFGWP